MDKVNPLLCPIHKESSRLNRLVSELAEQATFSPYGVVFTFADDLATVYHVQNHVRESMKARAFWTVMAWSTRYNLRNWDTLTCIHVDVDWSKRTIAEYRQISKSIKNACRELQKQIDSYYENSTQI